MMYPFPEDRLALARTDKCWPAENLSYQESALSCQLGARSCASYLAATRDNRLQTQATEPLLRSVQGTEITGWLGGSVHQIMDASGGCQVLSADDRFRQGLWEHFGYNTVANSAQGVQDSIQRRPIAPPIGLGQYTITSPAWGSPNYMILKYLKSTQTTPQPVYAFADTPY